MHLTDRFAEDFEDAIRRRGVDYFRKQRVLLDKNSISPTRVTAIVQGTERYRVDLRRAGPEMLVTCSCPYFGREPCKHLWATLLALDAKGLWQFAPGERFTLELAPSEIFDKGAAMGDGFQPYVPDLERYDALIPGLKRASELLFGDKHGSPARPHWRKQLASLRPASHAVAPAAQELWPATRELLYVIDVASSRASGALCLELMYRDRKKDGAWSKPKAQQLPRAYLTALTDQDDRAVLATLMGAADVYGFPYAHHGYGVSSAGGWIPMRYRLSNPQLELVLPAICRTGRCRLRLRERDEEPQWPVLGWEDGEPWQLRLEMRQDGGNKPYQVTGMLQRGPERMALSEPALLLEDGIVLARDKVMRYTHHGAFNWVLLLRQQGSIPVPVAQGAEFIAELQRQPTLPPLDAPEDLRYEEIFLPPRPRLVFRQHKDRWETDRLQAELSFGYGDTIVQATDTGRGIVQSTGRRVLVRDLAAESAAEWRLGQLGCQRAAQRYGNGPRELELLTRRLPELVSALTAEGWHVEAEGKVYRSSGQFKLEVSSGVDWFELHGEVRFGEATATLPELLAALKRGENTVRLGDGSVGLLPQDWLKQYGLLAGLGEVQGDHLRFTRSQVGLLDALLAAEPEAQCDASFVRVRDELRAFSGIEPREPPAGFKGELRPYQKDALGWFDFLQRFGFGGCLADDMGLGKTVQVLALLEARRKQKAGPSLAVVPKSLIFNWKQEAARFTPRLRVLDHTGNLRLRGFGHFEEYDLVLTTYGTLRSDATDFKDVKFDYVILDEAQAIKNASSVSAKAARLLKGDHRLALSGTPIENHLGELWSLFEFLNPGMLGAASVFKLAHGPARNPDEQTRRLLSQALRPFILRRTKDQVAKELPPRLEQTLYCDLDTRQRRLYNQLRDHYRSALIKRVEDTGLARSKIQVLEALLRLRQAAIHPGLLDKGREGESSAKLDVLLPRLLETIEEGHKTLVFSQFTGMLGILRQHLDKEGIVYEYLDGKTRDRQACVERFQTDADCKLFLISLKAGGVGLNLTAAQYVFLLDPWWNPAVEAQAIDRAHRIGQTRQVFACRLIARDTVEEKVLELQNTKRALADAIVGANEGLIRNLKREDLELLLS